MWMNIDGTIAQIYPNNQIHLEVRPEEYTTRIQLFPPPLKTSNQVTNHGRLNGRTRNKLLITPINNVLWPELLQLWHRQSLIIHFDLTFV